MQRHCICCCCCCCKILQRFRWQQKKQSFAIKFEVDRKAYRIVLATRKTKFKLLHGACNIQTIWVRFKQKDGRWTLNCCLITINLECFFVMSADDDATSTEISTKDFRKKKWFFWDKSTCCGCCCFWLSLNILMDFLIRLVKGANQKTHKLISIALNRIGLCCFTIDSWFRIGITINLIIDLDTESISIRKLLSARKPQI